MNVKASGTYKVPAGINRIKAVDFYGNAYFFNVSGSFSVKKYEHYNTHQQLTMVAYSIQGTRLSTTQKKYDTGTDIYWGPDINNK